MKPFHSTVALLVVYPFLSSVLVLLNSAMASPFDAFSFNDLYPVSGAIKSVKTLRNAQVVRQRYDYNCAAASLTTLLNYQYGEKYSENAITKGLMMMVKPEKRATIKQKGFSLLHIAKLSHELDYKTVSYNLDSLEELRELNFPSIVRVILNDISHFVVVKQITHNRVLLADPAWGNRSMTLYQFSKVWQKHFAFFVLPLDKRLGDKSLTNALTTTLPTAENSMDIDQISPNVWLQQDYDKFIVNTTPMVLSK